MARAAIGPVARQIESLFAAGPVAGLSDRQLLDRFQQESGTAAELAFAAIVARHGPMVLQVCGQLLGDRHLADDAFQAVFLVLARRAHSLRDPDQLVNWLYGVALRTARKARRNTRRRREHPLDQSSLQEPVPPSLITPSVTEQAFLDREQAELLHHEIESLPSNFRLPILLCYFEGLTLDEAAAHLACPQGTLRSRLARARDKLRHSLTDRGFSLTAIATARLPAPVCDATARAALLFNTSQGAAVTTSTTTAAILATQVLKTMIIQKIKLATLLLLAVGASIVTAVPAVRGLAAASEEPPKAATTTSVSQPAKLSPAPLTTVPASAPAAGRMFVTGRVLDQAGKAIPNATLVVFTRKKQLDRPAITIPIAPVLWTPGHANANGQFQIDTPRSSSARDEGLGVVAMAPGHGMGWALLDPNEAQPVADIILGPEVILEGRFTDISDQPAKDVEIFAANVGRIVDERVEFVPLGRWGQTGKNRSSLPPLAKSDADGRFALRGLGPASRVVLIIEDPRFATQAIRITTPGWNASQNPQYNGGGFIKVGDATNPKALVMALQPARVVTGRVTYADTGAAAGHAWLSLSSSGQGTGFSFFQADADGHFRVNTSSGDSLTLEVQADSGKPYLGTVQQLDWPKGAVKQTLDIKLVPGVVIEGRVVEDGSDKPVHGAILRFAPSSRQTGKPGHYDVPAFTQADGSFCLVTSPGPGSLVVQGPSDNYILKEFGINGGLITSVPGSNRAYAHEYQSLDLTPGGKIAPLTIKLRKGITIRGQAVGPDGHQVRDVIALSRLSVSNAPVGGWKNWFIRPMAANHAVSHGRFEVHGVDPNQDLTLYLIDPEHALGATAVVSGKSAATGLVTVPLVPCGSARMWFVDPNGKPVEGQDVMSLISLVVTPGPVADRRNAKVGQLFSDESELSWIDPVHYAKPVKSNARGEVQLPALIPGALYRIVDDSNRAKKPREIRKEFTVKPGEMLELGDILIEKPKR